MNTMRLFVKLLAVIKEQETSGAYNPLMFSQRAMGAPQRENIYGKGLHKHINSK